MRKEAAKKAVEAKEKKAQDSDKGQQSPSSGKEEKNR
jgi:hypothetical protein